MVQNAGGNLGIFKMLSVGALGRMTILALNITPYITASIIIQLLTAIVPSLEALKKEGEAGRKQINQYTRYATVGLAIFQAFFHRQAASNPCAVAAVSRRSSILVWPSAWSPPSRWSAAPFS